MRGAARRRPPRPVRYAVDPTAFVVALIGAPLLVTACTFWIGFIPLIALAMGGPVYLLLAIPVLLWDLPRHEPSFWRITAFGFLAAMSFAALLAIASLFVGGELRSAVMLYLIMGAIFGPLWAAPFAPIYLAMRRPVFAHDIRHSHERR